MCLQIDSAVRPFRRADNILQIKKKAFKAFFTPLETDGIIGKGVQQPSFIVSFSSRGRAMKISWTKRSLCKIQKNRN
jgi:hypothetical protein